MQETLDFSKVKKDNEYVSLERYVYRTDFSLKYYTADMVAADKWLKKVDLTKELQDEFGPHMISIGWVMDEDHTGFVDVVTTQPLNRAEMSEVSNWIKTTQKDVLGPAFARQDFADTREDPRSGDFKKYFVPNSKGKYEDAGIPLTTFHLKRNITRMPEEEIMFEGEYDNNWVSQLLTDSRWSVELENEKPTLKFTASTTTPLPPDEIQSKTSEYKHILLRDLVTGFKAVKDTVVNIPTMVETSRQFTESMVEFPLVYKPDKPIPRYSDPLVETLQSIQTMVTEVYQIYQKSDIDVQALQRTTDTLYKSADVLALRMNALLHTTRNVFPRMDEASLCTPKQAQEFTETVQEKLTSIQARIQDLSEPSLDAALAGLEKSGNELSQ